MDRQTLINRLVELDNAVDSKELLAAKAVLKLFIAASLTHQEIVFLDLSAPIGKYLEKLRQTWLN